MKTFLYSLLLVLVSLAAQAQPVDSWKTLGMVQLEKVYDATIGIEIDKPTVGPIIKSLEGKEILLTGYIIPLTGKLAQSHFMLSRYPQNMCFFCGKAGPETAAQVFMEGDEKIAFTEEKIKVKGILRINASDINNLLYTLDQAEIVE